MPSSSEHDARTLVKVRNTAILAAASAVETTVPHWPLPVIERIRARRIASIVRWAYDTVPFYSEAMRSAGLVPDDFRRPEDLARLPLVDGERVQDDIESFVSTAIPRNARKGFHTSGSTSGRRRLVFWDDHAMLMKAARSQRDRLVINRLAEESTLGAMLREFAGEGGASWQRALAHVAGDRADHQRLSIIPADYSSRTRRTFWSQLSFVPARAGHYSLLSPTEPYAAAADRLDAMRPRVVFSYGSYADEFLRYLDSSGRKVALPRLWVYMGDSVGVRGRELAGSLGCHLYSVYASIEAGAIGFQCERCEGFHLNVDICAVRVAGDDGATLPAGETGDIVVSNLENRAMVLLNYRQGDRGALGTAPCPCGRRLPLLERLEGRRSDVVTAADGRRLSALNLEGLFRHELKHVTQCQLHQPRPGTITWRLVPAAGVDRDTLRASVIERGRSVLGEDTELCVEFTDRIEKTARGKLLRVAPA
jgi:phenylacetate-CoA ligase